MSPLHFANDGVVGAGGVGFGVVVFGIVTPAHASEESAKKDQYDSSDMLVFPMKMALIEKAYTFIVIDSTYLPGTKDFPQ